MSKPFPCGCCCTNCPATDWRFRYCGISSSGTLLSSTSGNTLPVDLLGMGDVIFTPTSVIIGTGHDQQIVDLAILSGSSWTYQYIIPGETTLTFSELEMDFLVHDVCGKQYIVTAILSAKFTYSSGYTIRATISEHSQSAPSVVTCGNVLVANIRGTYTNPPFSAASGSIKAKPDDGISLTC